MPKYPENPRITLSGNSTSAGAGFQLIQNGTMTLAGGNNITLSQNGNAVTISGAAAGGAQTGISGIANSQTTYTSGSVTLSELGAITIRSTTGQQFQFSVNPQTTQTQGILSAGVSTGGNTAGNTTVNTGSRFVLVASGNATASQATAAGASTVTLSVGTQTVQTQDVLSIGVSTGGNTAGNTTVNTGSRFVIVGSGNLTASQGTAAGATTVTLSVAAGAAQTGISGIANSQTTYTSGTVSLSELGAITIRSTTGQQFQFSVNSQTVQTQDVLSIGVSTGGNTSGNTTVNTGSRFVIVGSNGITASQGTAAGATTVTLSGATQTVQTQGILNAGVSTGGNTSGDTTVNSGTRLVFVGTNNITLSQGTAANATTITISGGAGGGATFSGGMSTMGNTSGDTGYATQRLNLVGGNNITLSGSTNAGSMSITISAPNLGAGAMSVGVSDLGNTAGSTGVTGTRLVLVGSDNVTLSQSTDANGGTVSIIGTGPPRLSYWENLKQAQGSTAFSSPPDATLHIQPLIYGDYFPGLMTVSSIFFDISGSVSTGSAFTKSFSVGFYTSVNSTQLSLVASASTSWGTNAANMNIADSMAGRRWLTFQSSQFNNAPEFSESPYWIAFWNRSSSGAQTFQFYGGQVLASSGVRSGFISQVSSTNTTLGHYPFAGVYSASVTTAMPNNIAASDIQGTGVNQIFQPRIIFNNIQSVIV